ncbi:coordinator of PRMT5 and differentiation stimulator-like [Mobula hypostoma]|uniref:coordinator of PRMT5 and differentiation stimulator-like n=1 Tax=Mobula hypostoma TaxID=723540 RepID=UPI002FC39F22
MLEVQSSMQNSGGTLEISIEKTNRLRQELEQLAITPVWEGNKRPIWQHRKDQIRKDQDGTLVSDSQHLELQNTSLSSTEDENELEDDEADDRDYSDGVLSDYDISSTPEATCLSGMGVELFSEKEDWEKELNEACPYDEDDVEIIYRKSCCEGPLVWQDDEMYNPSHDHAPSSRTNVVEIPIVQGQFDDADE